MANGALFGGCRRETCSPQPQSVPEALSRVRSVQDPNPFPAFHLVGNRGWGPSIRPAANLPSHFLKYLLKWVT